MDGSAWSKDHQSIDVVNLPQTIPSGKQTFCYWKWPFIVYLLYLPIKHGDYPVRHVGLPGRVTQYY